MLDLCSGRFAKEPRLCIEHRLPSERLTSNRMFLQTEAIFPSINCTNSDSKLNLDIVSPRKSRDTFTKCVDISSSISLQRKEIGAQLDADREDTPLTL